MSVDWQERVREPGGGRGRFLECRENIFKVLLQSLFQRKKLDFYRWDADLNGLRALHVQSQ